MWLNGRLKIILSANSVHIKSTWIIELLSWILHYTNILVLIIYYLIYLNNN